MPGKKNAQPPPAAAAFPPQFVPMPPVKVFSYNDERGGWDDYGAGLVTVDYAEGSTSANEIVLAVIDMVNKETMLLHVIGPDAVYRKEQGTFISWSDPDAGMLLSLSFQDAAGCSSIWDTICQVQRKQRLDRGDGSSTNAPQE